MKKLILFLSIAVLAACSKPSQSTPPVVVSAVNTIDVSKLSVPSNTQITMPVIDFGPTDTKTKKVMNTVYITNPSDKAVNINIVPLSSTSGFTVFKNALCSKTLAANASCSLAIQFSNTGLYDGIYNDGVMVSVGNNSATIQMTAQVSENPYKTSDAGIDKIFLTLDSPFNLRGASYRTMTVSNIGTATSLKLDKTIPTGYLVRLSRCPSLLLPNSSCAMQIIYDNYASITDPPAGSADVFSGTTTTSINLVTGLSNFINNQDIFTNLFSYPKLINYQSGYTMIHYQSAISSIQKSNYKLIIVGE